ncbi:MAG: hypothetical protein LBR52_00080 [Prevotellaceae bacterium]|nr:hypothetical protein [Prevotellaceae bacterium]
MRNDETIYTSRRPVFNFDIARRYAEWGNMARKVEGMKAFSRLHLNKQKYSNNTNLI